MKLIIKQYLASLKERDELDALLPDLLSQMGLNVFSRPGKGTSEKGVDVAAVGGLDGGNGKIYLFSVKSGELNRKSWDGDPLKALRPSLNQILDAYIPTRLPHEHQGKEIVICLCFGGDIQVQVRDEVKGYIQTYTKECLSFEEWNGDKLADLILSFFLREDLLPPDIRPHLRKSLALLDEPEASFRHFSNLVTLLSKIRPSGDPQHIRAIRQINICLWILFAWARDAGNVESAYLSAEHAMLNAWELTKGHFDNNTKAAKSIHLSFSSILNVYQLICGHYIEEKIIPHSGKLHGLSSAVRTSSKIDVNLKLFDVLGRLATAGIWSYWYAIDEHKEKQMVYEQKCHTIAQSLKLLIGKNPTLLLPFKDEQAIDISLALLFLSLMIENESSMKNWLTMLVERAIFAYKCHGHYPCILRSYRDLLEHPKPEDDEYRKDVTSGSILYPTIALWAALLKENKLFEEIKAAKENQFKHCNFQLWYPDETSEVHLYVNSDLHGTVLSDVPVNLSPEEFLEVVRNESEQTKHFENLSALKHGYWPLILVACRHYRIPLPVHFMLRYRETVQSDESQAGRG